MNNAEILALQHLIEYVYSDEEEHWYENDCPKDHIYPTSIKPLGNYLDSPKVQNRRTILDFTE
jgi:hypothetical protein